MQVRKQGLACEYLELQIWPSEIMKMLMVDGDDDDDDNNNNNNNKSNICLNKGALP
jgi:hypothetical protein